MSPGFPIYVTAREGKSLVSDHLLIEYANATDHNGSPSSRLRSMSPPATQPTYHIASIPGDGIGAEVIGAGITVLQKLAHSLGTFSLQFDHFDWSSQYYKAHGRYIPEGGLEELKNHNAIFFGAVGDPGVPVPNRNSCPKIFDSNK